MVVRRGRPGQCRRLGTIPVPHPPDASNISPKGWQPKILQTFPATPWGTKWESLHSRMIFPDKMRTCPAKRSSKPWSWETDASDSWLQSPKLCLVRALKNPFKRLNFDLCLHHASADIDVVLPVSERRLWTDRLVPSVAPCAMISSRSLLSLMADSL